jgi:hypothetical protein
MRVIVATLIAVVGCGSSTHHSVLTPYVRELKPVQGGIEAVSCGIVFTETETTSWNWFRFDTESETERAVSHGPCWQVVIPTQVVPR